MSEIIDDYTPHLERCDDCGNFEEWIYMTCYFEDEHEYFLCSHCDYLRWLSDSQRKGDENDLPL